MPLQKFPVFDIAIRAGEGTEEPRLPGSKQDSSDKVEAHLRRISKYYQPDKAIAFDYETRVQIAPHTRTTATIFTVSRGYRIAIIRGLGLFSNDLNAFSMCYIRWYINGAPPANFIYSVNSRVVSSYDYASLYECYVEVPKNAAFQVNVNNTSATTTYNVYARAVGWFEPE